MAQWQPTTSIALLKQRANLLRNIREFFFQRNVVEVEVPLLAQHGVTDPYNDNFEVSYFNQSLFLQTSPEYHLKRLLCAGAPDVYQLAKAFRYEEHGKHHNPEFTMLEWYRIDWTYQQLIQEVIELVQCIIGPIDIAKYSYQDLFLHFCDFDPLTISTEALQKFAKSQQIVCLSQHLSKDDWLNLIFTQLIEPQFKTPQNNLVIISDYPKSQAALAQVEGQIAKRFEIYLNGIELANGFQELSDPKEQRLRFEADNVIRNTLNKMPMKIDPFFLDALEQGHLPNCSGVALGVDRLLMAACEKADIQDVLSFSIANA